MRVGGFVIFRDNARTLKACLESLLAVSDDIVAVDTGSRDGAADLARASNARVVQTPWRGYGDARAFAVRHLQACDYVFYLDSDERLGPGSAEAFVAWKRGETRAPRGLESYRVHLRDWVDWDGCRFVYRSGTRHRLVRADKAVWKSHMIVHETLGLPRSPVLPITIEHEFVSAENLRLQKDDRYALLWALRGFVEGHRAKPPVLDRFAMMTRDLLFKGALFRGGAKAARVAWSVSGYHQKKHAYLQRLRRGELQSLVEAYRSGALDALYDRLLPEALGTLGAQ